MTFDQISMNGNQAPMDLFIEITFITDLDTKSQIEQHCLQHSADAIIQYDSSLRQWIWHTLYLPGHTTLTKPIAKQFDPPRKAPRTLEKELVTALVEQFAQQGMLVDRAVPCAIGEADLVTRMRDIVYEVKVNLTRSSLFQAVGQVLLYRLCINPDARAVIIGHSTNDTQALMPYIAALGIEVILLPPRTQA
jgi:hypothetical protein